MEISWNIHDIGSNNSIQAIDYGNDINGNDLYILVYLDNLNNVYIQKSSNGITWVNYPTHLGTGVNKISQIKCNGSTWIITGIVTIWRSTDSIIWSVNTLDSITSSPNGTVLAINDIIYTGKNWICCGYGSSNTTFVRYSNNDGINWFNANNVANLMNPRSISYNNNSQRLIITSSQNATDNKSAYSDDHGINWIAISDNVSGFTDGNSGLQNVINYNGSKWISGGSVETLHLIKVFVRGIVKIMVYHGILLI